MKPYYQEPNCQLYQGHALGVLKTLPSESVDCCMTSPPYWGLRTYKTELIDWNGWKGELGLEPTIELYIEHLILIFNEVKRVLKRTGTLWVNIGDSYSGMKVGNTETKKNPSVVTGEFVKPKIETPSKSLCAIPERFMLAMMSAGWICRNDIIWYKANPMPESVKDRFTGTYEHLYFFVQSKKYWFEQQFEDRQGNTHSRGTKRTPPIESAGIGHEKWCAYMNRDDELAARNKRDVWEINTEPYPEAHFATFPEKLCETPILAGCPSQICTKCGKAREPIYNRKSMVIRKSEGYTEQSGTGTMLEPAECEKTGYTDCGCNEPFEPGVVLDMFCGSGTTLAVAKRLNRKSIGIELNESYCKLAQSRISKIPLPMELKV